MNVALSPSQYAHNGNAQINGPLQTEVGASILLAEPRLSGSKNFGLWVTSRFDGRAISSHHSPGERPRYPLPFDQKTEELCRFQFNLPAVGSFLVHSRSCPDYRLLTESPSASNALREKAMAPACRSDVVTHAFHECDDFLLAQLGALRSASFHLRRLARAALRKDIA